MRRVAIWLSAAVCSAAVGVVAPATSASAAGEPCPKGTGVTVVVGDVIRCDADGGGTVESNLLDVGYRLTEVRRQPGFLCQVDGFPESSCVNTPPADAYWGFFDSDGKTGTWRYSQLGMRSLKLPQGSWFGLRFQTSNSTVAPSVKPLAASSGGSATGGGGASTGQGGSTSGSDGTAVTPTPGATATTPGATPDAEKTEKAKKAEKSGSPSATPAPTGTPDPRFEQSAAVQPASQSSSLIWVAAAIGLLLALGMGWVVWQRRAARP